jgi:hypothetical protein
MIGLAPSMFWMVGTDKEAIKKEMCRVIDSVFEMHENSEGM